MLEITKVHFISAIDFDILVVKLIYLAENYHKFLPRKNPVLIFYDFLYEWIFVRRLTSNNSLEDIPALQESGYI